MTVNASIQKTSLADSNRSSERGEQLIRFLNLAIGDDQVMELIPDKATLDFRAITVEGKPFQITAFRAPDDEHAPWQARITIGDLEWDQARGLEVDAGSFPTAEAAIDALEGRLRDALSTVEPWSPAAAASNE